jgi:hypothetical protein
MKNFIPCLLIVIGTSTGLLQKPIHELGAKIAMWFGKKRKREEAIERRLTNIEKRLEELESAFFQFENNQIFSEHPEKKAFEKPKTGRKKVLSLKRTD